MKNWACSDRHSTEKVEVFARHSRQVSVEKGAQLLESRKARLVLRQASLLQKTGLHWYCGLRALRGPVSRKSHLIRWLHLQI